MPAADHEQRRNRRDPDENDETGAGLHPGLTTGLTESGSGGHHTKQINFAILALNGRNCTSVGVAHLLPRPV